MLRNAARGLAAGRAPITRPSWFASMAAQEWISGSDVNDGPVPPAMKTACPGPEVTSPFPIPCRRHSVAAFLCAPSLSRTRPVPAPVSASDVHSALSPPLARSSATP